MVKEKVGIEEAEECRERKRGVRKELRRWRRGKGDMYIKCR